MNYEQTQALCLAIHTLNGVPATAEVLRTIGILESVLRRSTEDSERIAAWEEFHVLRDFKPSEAENA